jgi:TIR domain
VDPEPLIPTEAPPSSLRRGPLGKAPADLILSLALLAPGAETLSAVAGFFGYTETAETNAEAADSREPTVPHQPEPSPAPSCAPRPSQLDELAPEITRGTPDEAPPAWLATVAPLSYEPLTPAYRAPIRPLFKPVLTRALLTGAAAQDRSFGEVDVEALLTLLGQGILPKTLPRRAVPTVGRLHLLLDAGRAMESFAGDINLLIDDAVRFVGRDRVRVVWFRGCPGFGIFLEDGSQAAATMPGTAGESILIVSDLSIANVRGSGAATTTDWIAFANLARRQDSPLTAIVPYPSKRIPGELSARMRVLTWDESTGVRALRRRLRRPTPLLPRPVAGTTIAAIFTRTPSAALELAERASLAARAEPQLLRALRTNVAPELDIGAETDLFVSELIEARSSAGIVLRNDLLDALRARLRASPERLDSCWAVTASRHHGIPRAVRYEEELTYLALRGLDDTCRAQQAIGLLRQLVTSWQAARLGLWGPRAVVRLPGELFAMLDEARMLATAIGRSTADPRVIAKLPEGSNPHLYGWLHSDLTTLAPAYMRLVEGGVEFTPEPLEHSHEIAAPSDERYVVELRWRDGRDQRRRIATIDRSRREVVEIDGIAIELHLPGGPSYRLRPLPVLAAHSERPPSSVVKAAHAHDIFISYAHADDQPRMDQSEGWVTTLVRHLNNGLARRVGRDDAISVWFDHDPSGATRRLLDETAEIIRNSAIFVAITSPAYLASAFCRNETEVFVRNLVDSGSNRMFAVEMAPVEAAAAPLHALARRHAYRFWYVDTQGAARRLEHRKSNADQIQYFRLLEDLTRDIYEQLKRISFLVAGSRQAAAAAPTRAEAKAVVFLAETTDDLAYRRDELRRFLTDYGVLVLPEGDPAPDRASFEAMLATDLPRSQLFIQLLGPFPGKRPAEVPDGYSWLQYEAARQRELPILQWRSPETDPAQCEWLRHRELLELPTVQATSLESFKAAVAATLKPPPLAAAPRPAGERPLVFLNTEPRHRTIAAEIRTALANRADLAEPLFEGPPEEVRLDLEQNLLDCDAMVMLYADNPGWARAQLRQFRKLAPRRERPVRAIVVVDLPPSTKPDLGVHLPEMVMIDCRHGIAPNIGARIAELLQA